MIEGWASVRECHSNRRIICDRDRLVGREARAVALSLPEAVEQDHHGRPSFRVGGKIFATLWSDERTNVMLDESGILTAIDRAPGACEQVWWGKRLAAVGITLSRVDRQFLGELLTDGWEQKAPRRLLTR